MTDNLPVPTHESAEVVVRRDHRQLPPYAYVKPGLGDLTLLARVDDVIRLLTEVVRPQVVNFEAQQPQPLECVICHRNFGGWPLPVLQDHWFQHSWLQRKLASWGVR